MRVMSMMLHLITATHYIHKERKGFILFTTVVLISILMVVIFFSFASVNSVLYQSNVYYNTVQERCAVKSLVYREMYEIIKSWKNGGDYTATQTTTNRYGSNMTLRYSVGNVIKDSNGKGIEKMISVSTVNNNNNLPVHAYVEVYLTNKGWIITGWSWQQ